MQVRSQKSDVRCQMSEGFHGGKSMADLDQRDLLLALDLGNTNLVIGIFKKGQLVRSFRFSTDRTRTADEYGVMLNSLIRHEGFDVAALDGVAISNVVPALGPMLADLSQRHLARDPLFVTADSQLGIRICVDNPHQLGADLIVAAEEAYARFGGPTVVIDMGTATTISALSANGEFLGTAIGPGLSVSADAIYQRAPHLPRILFEPPPRPWGTNTVHSMQAGLLLGHAAMVDGLVERFKQELGESARVVATGGLADTLVRACRQIDEVVPDMVLQGIRRIYERNKVQGLGVTTTHHGSAPSEP